MAAANSPQVGPSKQTATVSVRANPSAKWKCPVSRVMPAISTFGCTMSFSDAPRALLIVLAVSLAAQKRWLIRRRSIPGSARLCFGFLAWFLSICARMIIIQRFAMAVRRGLCITVLLAAAGCDPSPPGIDAVKSRFAAERQAGEELRALIAQDSKGRELYAVGLDHIGDFWEYEGKWTRQRDGLKAFDLGEVLEAERIGHDRYEKYKQLFKRLQAERVTRRADKDVSSMTRILVYRSGAVMSGCVMELLATAPAPQARGQRGNGGFVEVTDLGGGWYVEYGCS